MDRILSESCPDSSSGRVPASGAVGREFESRLAPYQMR